MIFTTTDVSIHVQASGICRMHGHTGKLSRKQQFPTVKTSEVLECAFVLAQELLHKEFSKLLENPGEPMAQLPAAAPRVGETHPGFISQPQPPASAVTLFLLAGARVSILDFRNFSNNICIEVH